jgi:selenocysteine-specific elongation factor
MIARASHRPSLPPEIVPAAEKIRAALAEKPFDPPSRKDLSQDRHFQQALRFLIGNGEVVEVAPEVVLLRESLEQMEAQVVELISKNGPSTVSQLRETLQSSRRVIVPFLEYLDRTGVTQRSGDLRRLHKTKSAVIARR